MCTMTRIIFGLCLSVFLFSTNTAFSQGKGYGYDDDEYREIQHQRSPEGQAELRALQQSGKDFARDQAIRLGPIGNNDKYYQSVVGGTHPQASAVPLAGQEVIQDMTHHFGIVLGR